MDAIDKSVPAADLVAEAEARDAMRNDCRRNVYEALAPILREYGGRMTEEMVRGWLGVYTHD